MLPAFLITIREVIEASLIIATILGILVKLGQKKEIQTVWYASLLAGAASMLFLILGSLLGLKAQELYSGKIKGLIEGILMIASAFFITWAVFFLHHCFARYKIRLLAKIKKTVEKEKQKGLFLLVFTAVGREGFEIVLFLSTVYFSANPYRILLGFAGGVAIGLAISLALFGAALKMPVYTAFKTTSVLLIVFAAGLLAQGVHELMEFGLLPEIGKITLAFIPEKTTFIGDMLKGVFGITQKMDMIQLSLYASYVLSMSWHVFLRRKSL